MKKIQNNIKTFFVNLLSKWLEDFFIVVGAGIIIGTTYTISLLIANYILGAVLLLFGVILAKK